MIPRFGLGWLDGGVQVTPEAFEELVGEALDGVPSELSRLMDNVVVLVEENPPEDNPDLLGLYCGTPLTERDSGYTFREPDRILIYRAPLLEMCASEQQLVDEVRITVVHEIAHHFGIDDAQLHSLGYG
ncbi:MAG: metallopeptidase family protein [Actinomycetota bacterium]|nr:metallopeptidase family protein [Actinomycetota bacterium]